MKEIYLDIMEKALSAYTDERIAEYIAEVRRDGLTEHGFPRLGANIGILMAHGRCLELKNVFVEKTDIIDREQTVLAKLQPNNFTLRWVM